MTGFLVSDRNRADLRFIDGEFSWRYRNRLTVERTVSILSYHFSPYVRGEVYFDSNYEKWSRTSGTLGGAFPISQHTEIEIYYEHQNDTGKSPNRQVECFGNRAQPVLLTRLRIFIPSQGARWGDLS